MRLVALGVGSGFVMDQFHSNYLLETGQARLLIDAGTTIRYSLAKAGVELQDITYILITHFHHDHAGGLSELLLKGYWTFDEGIHKPHLMTVVIREEQLQDLEATLAPSMNNQGMTWRDFCHVVFFEEGEYEVAGVKMNCIVTDNLHCEGMESYALRIEEDGRNIVLTGDIKKLPESDLLAHIDEQTIAVIQDVTLYENPIHASLQDVLAYYPSEVLKKVWAVHYEAIIPDAPIPFLKEGQIIE